MRMVDVPNAPDVRRRARASATATLCWLLAAPLLGCARAPRPVEAGAAPAPESEPVEFEDLTPARDAREYVVAPDGTPGGDGSAARPWDLATAVSGTRRVRPGDRLTLKGGTYPGPIVSAVSGAEGRPVVVRAAEGERVVVEGRAATERIVDIRGAWTTWIGLEVTDSDPERVDDGRPHGIAVFGVHTRVINCVVHDCGSGIGFWEPAADSEVSGCVIYNNGNTVRDHGIYVQNRAGVKKIRGNVIFDNSGFGIHAYGTRGYVDGLTVDGNVVFNNGSLGAGGSALRSPNLYVGTQDNPCHDVRVERNVFYQPAGSAAGHLRLGIGASGSENLTIAHNYVACGAQALEVVGWRSATVARNTIVVGDTRLSDAFFTLVQPPAGLDPATYVWSRNVYFDATTPSSDGTRRGFSDRRAGARWLTFDEWRGATGYDLDGRYEIGYPAGPDVLFLADRHDRRRAIVVAVNWLRAAAVRVDVGDLVPPGARYEVRAVEDVRGTPVASGSLAGRAIDVPTTGWQVAKPVGLPAADTTAPVFCVYLLTWTDAAANAGELR